MTGLLRILLIAVSLACGIRESTGVEVFEVLKLTKLITSEILHAWEMMSPESKDHPLPPFLVKDDTKLLSRFDVIQAKLDAIDTEVKSNTAGIVDTLRRSLPQVVRNELRISNLLQILAEIDRKDKLLKVYRSIDRKGAKADSLWEFTTSIISQDYNSVLSMWDRLHSTYMLPEMDSLSAIPQSSILHQMADTVQEYEENLCNIQQSPMQLLYNLYNSLQISQLKAYTLMQFSWLYRKTTNESFSYDEESRFMKDLYLSRLSKQAEVAKDAMTKVSQALWRCDPREHVEDETYTSLTHFLQGFILNEVDMNSEITCREDCPFYKYTKQYGCYKGNYCAKQPTCRGNVVNCKFLDSDMWVCPGDYKKSKRRYDWIKYENGRTLGQVDGSCKKNVDKVDSWWRWLFWHCSFCFCLCDESENINSDRYFSLSPTLSDVKNNRVLTGLKFVKKNQVIYIEGQEGELRPNGEINATSIRWIPLKTVNPHSSENIEGLEYYKMSWNQRAVDLDDLKAPPGHVLTGVKWRKVGGHLNFEIQACRWNFTTGILTQGGLKCQWISNDNTDASLQNPRKKIYLNAPDVPTKIRVPSRIDSKTDEFVEFTHTDMDADVAQTAVPFLDIQPVVPEPPVPLIGAGIYHKGMYKSGGYIAPKVFTLDYTQHIQTDFNAI